MKTDFSGGMEGLLLPQRAGLWTDCETRKSQGLLVFDTVALQSRIDQSCVCFASRCDVFSDGGGGNHPRPTVPLLHPAQAHR